MKRAEAKIELLNKGFIKIKNEYGEGYFKLIQANENTLGQNTEKLLEQLKNEGKYNYWIGVYNFRTESENSPVDIDRLPVYGDPNKFVDVVKGIISLGYDVHFVKPVPTDESEKEFINRAENRGNNKEWINKTIKYLKPLPLSLYTDEELKFIFIHLVPFNYYLTDFLDKA